MLLLGTILREQDGKVEKEQEGAEIACACRTSRTGALERRLTVWTLLQSCSPWSVVRASAASCAIDSCDATP